MIIDDHELFRDTLSAFLTASGFEVIEACDGQSGMTLYHEKRPHLVITDINMPGKNGVKVVQEILAEEGKASLFVISGLPNSDAFFQAAKNLGVDRCFAKPLNLSELCDAIHEVLT